MATTTASRHQQNDTLETLVGLALLWLIPVLAFVVALFIV